MANFPKMRLTNAGLNLLTNVQAGADDLTFTKTALGDGELTTPLASLTALVSPKVECAITEGKKVGTSTYQIGAFFSNTEINVGFWWREIGVYAKGNDGNEILYCYSNAGDAGDFIPVGSDERVEKYIYQSLSIGNAESVTAEINGSDTYIPAADKGKAGGVAPLGDDGKIPEEYIGFSLENDDGGFAGGTNASATQGGAVGYGAKSTKGGGAVGQSTTTTAGGAVGSGATAGYGGAVGSLTSATTGGAVGEMASETAGGGAVGYSTNATTGGAVGKSAKETIGGGAVGENANATSGGAVGNGASATDGGAVGNGAKETSGGGAVGKDANTTMGGAVGQAAKALTGGAVGVNTETTSGGAVGSGAKAASGGGAVGNSAEVTSGGGAIGTYTDATDGGAVGSSAKAGSGFAGRKQAQTVDASGNLIDAVQLGTGTNQTPKTVQAYGFQLMDANGYIPEARIPTKLRGYTLLKTMSYTTPMSRTSVTSGDGQRFNTQITGVNFAAYDDILFVINGTITYPAAGNVATSYNNVYAYITSDTTKDGAVFCYFAQTHSVEGHGVSLSNCQIELQRSSYLKIEKATSTTYKTNVKYCALSNTSVVPFTNEIYIGFRIANPNIANYTVTPNLTISIYGKGAL